MKFRYEYVPGQIPGSLSLQPRVLIKFTNPETNKSIVVNALVDSGATVSFLNIAFADDLGVVFSSEAQGTVFSANQRGVAYYHDLAIKVQKDTHEFLLPCGFMELSTDAVVGQAGFFEHYRVVFERYNKTFELIYQG